MARSTTSRGARWSTAIGEALDIVSQMEDLRSQLESAVGDVQSIQEEFSEWKDNLPENLQGSALGEKLEAVCDLDFDVLDNIDLDTVRSALEEAEGADLPLGFGRD